MFKFHNRVIKAFQIMQRATNVLSKKMTLLKRRILEY